MSEESPFLKFRLIGGLVPSHYTIQNPHCQEIVTNFATKIEQIPTKNRRGNATAVKG
jgi:hypothetical protein